jgi:ferredoxin
MPSLLLLPIQKQIVDDAKRKLLGLIVSAGLPIGRSCEGEGICGACRVIVFQDGLSKPSALETSTLQRINAKANERLACCARLVDNSSIGCPAWGEIK